MPTPMTQARAPAASLWGVPGKCQGVRIGEPGGHGVNSLVLVAHSVPSSLEHRAWGTPRNARSSLLLVIVWGGVLGRGLRAAPGLPCVFCRRPCLPGHVIRQGVTPGRGSWRLEGGPPTPLP